MNPFDTRNRPAGDVVADLRTLDGLKLAVLGSNDVPAKAAAEAFVEHRRAIVDLIGGRPVRLVTSCRPVGAEKAARLAAKEFTGSPAVVFHRAEITYGVRPADMMANMIIAQEADALVVLTTGSDVCGLVKARFESNGKNVYEIEFM